MPKTLIEDDLAFVFDPYGRILDLTVVRDRRTGSHWGCAFVTYKREGDTVRVAEKMHGKYKFDGNTWPAQVRPAAGEIDDAEGGASGRQDAEGEKNMLFEIEDVENYSDI